MLIKNIKTDSNFPEQLEGEVYFPLFGEVYFPLFGKDIAVWGFTQNSVDYANECAALLVKLSEELISKLCQSSIMYCNTFLEEVGEETKHFENEKDVLHLISPSGLIIDDGASVPVIHMELNCEWEEEHGMEWIVRDNVLQYVGAFNGESAFGDFTEKEEWNFA